MNSLKPESYLGSKLLVFILLFSSVITILTTGLQLYVEYDKDVNQLEKTLRQTSETHLQSLATHLWNFDIEYATSELNAILTLPGMQYLEIKDDDKILTKVGHYESQNTIKRSFPLIYYDGKKIKSLGILTSVANMNGIYERLERRIFVILIGQGIKTFLVSLFILLLFNSLVTKHLQKIAEYADNFDLKRLNEPLILNRNKKLGDKVNDKDELDIVVNAFNQMRVGLQNSYTELESKNKALIEKNELKDQFLANTSHELRTPLNGIIGIAESLSNGAAGSLSSLVKYNLSLIFSSGKRLLRLVDDILDFSKLKHHDIKLSLQPVDIYSILEVMITLSAPLIGNKKIELYNETPENLPLVTADENRVQQIIHNLLGNAIKFTERGAVKISAFVEKNFVKVIISDTGIGIAPEQRDRIFRDFEQADGSISRGYTGVGLGLTISKKLVELHDGKIELTSTIGKGTAISFSLPISEKQEILKPANDKFENDNSNYYSSIAKIETPDLNNRSDDSNYFNLLVVDDELIVRHLIFNYLKMEKFNIRFASNGKEALKMVDARKPDLILLDVMMPQINGFEVCQIIRETHSTSEIPIIFLSARKELKDKLIGFNEGANDYIEKPIFQHELIARIRNQVQILIANRRMNSFLKFSHKISEFKDSKELVKAAFQQIISNLYINGAIVLQGKTIIDQSGDAQSLQFLEKKNYEELTANDEVLKISMKEKLPGELFHLAVKGFEEYRIILYKKLLNGSFSKPDIQYVHNVINEIHQIRGSISKMMVAEESKEKIVKIKKLIKDINYIKSGSPFCEIYLSGNKEILEIEISMREMELYLPDETLVRVHRQYFVNPEKISSFNRKKSKDYEIIINKEQIPVGRTYLKKLREKYSELFFN